MSKEFISCGFYKFGLCNELLPKRVECGGNILNCLYLRNYSIKTPNLTASYFGEKTKNKEEIIKILKIYPTLQTF
ncbi:MAG: hypothetical protein QXD48_02275 [Candidatus Aenigmatarchaeota archaeon]